MDLDCVVSYHLNPATCGVAKFNVVLAQHLGTSMLGILDNAVLESRRPLLSVKVAEFAQENTEDVERRIEHMLATQSVSLFLHTFSDTPLEQRMLRDAAAVFCANAELHAQVSRYRPDAIELWCPGTILSEDRFPRTEISVFTFGMAHKVRADTYVRLQQLLERTGRDYALYLSTALHENTSFDESFGGAFEEMRRLFNGKVHFVGFLSDAAVYNYLMDSTFFAAFFEKGVRANNTSVNAAMSSGAVVITNLDELSPPSLQHGWNVLDVMHLDRLPLAVEELSEIGRRAQETSQNELGWSKLVSALQPSIPGAGRLNGTANPQPVRRR